MKLFATRAVRHIAHRLSHQKGAITIKDLHDGELYVKIEEPVQNMHVWVLAATPSPMHHSMELLLILDALHRAGAKISLCLTYCGYARQDRYMQDGEAVGAEIIGHALQRIPLVQTYILHPHSALLQQYIPHTPIFPLDLVASLVRQNDVLVAADMGVRDLTHQIGEHVGVPVAYVMKKRLSPDDVMMLGLEGDVAGKRVLLVDDIIATGNTMVQAARLVQSHGAANIRAFATHSFLTHHTHMQVAVSPISHMYVMNSMQQSIESPCMTVLDVVPTLETSLC